MRNFKKIVLVGGLSAVTVLTSLTGCSTWGHKDSDRSAGRVVDDRRITSAVEDQLKTEPVYKFSDVDVKTFNGVVQLSGFVTTEDQKERAGSLAEHVPGVAQVVNGITLKPEPLTPTGRTDGTQPPRSYSDNLAPRSSNTSTNSDTNAPSYQNK